MACTVSDQFVEQRELGEYYWQPQLAHAVFRYLLGCEMFLAAKLLRHGPAWMPLTLVWDLYLSQMA